MSNNNFCALHKPEPTILSAVQPTLFEPLKTYGISKNVMRSQLLNTWNFEKEFRKSPALAYYRQLEVTSVWFFCNVSEGTIVRDGITFIVVYHQCSRYTCKYESTKVQLSFRKAQAVYGLEAYVLVRPL